MPTTPETTTSAPAFTRERADELTDRIRSDLNEGVIDVDEANRLQSIVGEKANILLNPGYAAHVNQLKQDFPERYPAEDPYDTDEYFKK